MYERKRQSFRSMWAQALRLRKKKKENRMKKRVVCLLLTLAMLLGMLPAMALAANEHAITASPKTAYETTQGAMLKIPMSEVFADSEGHEMTYTLNSTDLGEHTSVSNHDTSNPTDSSWKLFFTQQKTGVYTASITAACAQDAGVTATATLTITVKEGEKGDERQYGYDETPQDSVRVYVTISNDGVPIRGKDGTVLSHLEVNVPYFDLGNQDLSDFYRYHTENGSGSYMDDNIVQRPTALHLYLYMIGVYYLGYTPEEVTTGARKVLGAAGNIGVQNLFGADAYEDSLSALMLGSTSSPTSLYMANFWGHDENLMYYRNHVYPLMGPNWGATSDYMLLSDDDTIDVALFTDWSFWNDGGAFACFDLDEYSVQPGRSVTFSTMKYDTKSVADGGTETMEPIAGLSVSVYDENWKKVAEVEPLTAGGSSYTYTFPTAGTYYLLGIDPNAGTTSARKAPATAKVTVDSKAPVEPEGNKITLAGSIIGSSADSSFADLEREMYTCRETQKKTGLDVLKGVLDAKGYRYTATATEITSITDLKGVTLANGDERYGPQSAWVATVNGERKESLSQFVCLDGDEFALTFTECPKNADGKHADADQNGACDVCGKVLTGAVKVPHLIEGVSAEKKDTVQAGKAYLLSELQAGRIFEGPDGEKLTYTNYYYQRSTDGGQTWGAQMHFTEALFGGTTIQLTELEAGTYTYRFTASTDGKNFSADTWTLTLNVVKDAPLNFTVHVGRDYNYSKNGNVYPIIKVYPSLGWDEKTGEAIPDKDNPVTLLYSDFTSTLPEGTTEYDPAKGTLVSNYNTFYLSAPAGDYYFESWGWDAEAQDYTVSLGGMPLTLPTDTNVDGGAGGGNTLYLQCNSFYVNSRKADNTSYFTADEYYVKLVCPIMGGPATMGTPYISGKYTYYPVMLYAAGNACLYNVYAYPTIEGYIFTQTINQTYQAGYSANTKSLSINVELTLAVTVPSEARFDLYFQWNNFNTTAVEPFGSWKDNGDGTKTIEYPVSKGNGNYTWRLSDSSHVTQAGWLASQSANAAVKFSFAADAPTDRHSHDFSKLGSQTIKRDEADLQVNLDPSGYEAIGDTTRVRAYRHWEIINSDAGNIMIEPDFHWFVYRGDAKLQTVDGGNTTANWADVTPGTQDSILTVYYDSVDVNPGSYGTHGGLYPATQPNRLGVIVVGGTGVVHGTADADVDFNMDSGTATTRSMDWDYNYDTWFYGANETAPTLDFAVKATGSVTVEYAFVTATDNLDTVMQDYKAVSAGSDGRYAVPLAGFRDLGAGKGGTVILKMTDSTGTSYRLVRVAEVTITAENVSNPEEAIMPGDEVRLTFRGMYRAVNKISGVFNPLIFEPTYYYGGTKYTGKLGQYQRMDSAAVTVTVPKDIEFAEGSDTAELRLTDGYTFGSMYSAANPFAFLYNMTDTGAGTNFNAPTVTYYMNHYADALITVSRKVLYDTALRITDEEGKTLTDVSVTLTGPDGAVTADENGRYQLGYGSYSYTLVKSGYVCTRGSFSLGSADAEKVQNGVLTRTLAEMVPAGENPWDGAAKTEPQKDGSGAYLIGTAAELAWYAASDGKTAAKLTADIELAGFDWTPMKNLYGKFDGQGHVVRNLYINSSSYPVGLFGYVKTGASVTRLGVTGSVTCTAKSYARAGGIAGSLEDNAPITECFSTVDVSSRKHGGGIAGYSDSSSVISDCYAAGSITTTSPNECYLGGICGSFYNQHAGATLTNCYFAGTVTGSGGNASYVGGVSCTAKEEYYTNCFYLAGTVSGESPKYGVTGKGTAKTADELRALAGTLGDKFAAGQNGVNGGFPVLAWQNGGSEPVILLGDVNGDGKVDNADAALVYAFYNGKVTLNDDQKKAANVNGDELVDNSDAALIYARYNGKITKFPAEQ